MSIIVFGCSKDDNSPTEPIEQNLTVESNNVKTFEVVSVTVNNLELTDNTYQATFGNSEITLVKFDDNSLIFSIPEIEEGTYSLSLSLGTVELNVTETQVLNTDEIIQDVFDDFSADNRTLEDFQSYLRDLKTNIDTNIIREPNSADFLKSVIKFSTSDNKNTKTNYNYFGRTKFNVFSFTSIMWKRLWSTSPFVSVLSHDFFNRASTQSISIEPRIVISDPEFDKF